MNNVTDKTDRTRWLQCVIVQIANSAIQIVDERGVIHGVFIPDKPLVTLEDLAQEITHMTKTGYRFAKPGKPIEVEPKHNQLSHEYPDIDSERREIENHSHLTEWTEPPKIPDSS